MDFIIVFILIFFLCIVKYSLSESISNKFSVVFSIVMSNLSSTMILGIPMEIYLFGTQIFWGFIAEACAYFFIIDYFLIKFYECKCESIYEYLEQRFGRVFKKIFIFQFIIPGFLFVPLYLYLSCLTINQIYMINIDVLILSIGFLCSCLTFSGVKNLISLDFINAIILLFVILFIIIISTTLQTSHNFISTILHSERLNYFMFNPSPFLRISFIPMLLSSFISGVESVSLDEGVMIKLKQFGTLKEKKEILKCVYIGIFLIKSVLVFFGLLIYEKYTMKDPVLLNVISQYKNIVPLFVKETMADFPLFIFLFVYSVVSTSFSCILIRIHTSSTIVYDIFSTNTNKLYKNIISSCVCLICILITLVIKNLTDIYQLVISFCGLLTGGNFGIFVMGFYFKHVGNLAICIGNFTSLFVNSMLIIGYQYMLYEQKFVYKTRPLYAIINGTTISNEIHKSFSKINYDLYIKNLGINYFFLISFVFYNLIGFIVLVSVSLLASFAIKLITRKKQVVNI